MTLSWVRHGAKLHSSALNSPALVKQGGGFLLCIKRLSYILPETRTKAHKMDTTKWKSVLVPVEVYRELKILSAIEGRTISGQLRFMFDQYSKLKSVRNKLKQYYEAA